MLSLVHLLNPMRRFASFTHITRLPGVVMNTLPVMKLAPLSTTQIGTITSAWCAFMLVKFQAIHKARKGEGMEVRNVAAVMAKLIINLGYSVEAGTSKAKIVLQAEKAAISLTESMLGKLAQTKQSA